jgi:hypothetical protein
VKIEFTDLEKKHLEKELKKVGLEWQDFTKFFSKLNIFKYSIEDLPLFVKNVFINKINILKRKGEI